jgi:hypothetical protein
VTEVKNSTDEKTLKRGVKEALEYLAFLRDGDGFLNKLEVFGGDKSDLLMLQGFEDRKVQEVDTQGSAYQDHGGI